MNIKHTITLYPGQQNSTRPFRKHILVHYDDPRIISVRRMGDYEYIFEVDEAGEALPDLEAILIDVIFCPYGVVSDLFSKEIKAMRLLSSTEAFNIYVPR